MSFLKKLFGGGSKDDAGEKIMDSATYNDFVISAIEMKVGSEYQLCGKIEKEIGGETKVHSFIRADRISSRDQAIEAIVNKGRQIIDEQGERIF